MARPLLVGTLAAMLLLLAGLSPAHSQAVR